MPVPPGSKWIKLNVQSPAQSPHWNQVPNLPAVRSPPVVYRRQKVDLLRSVRLPPPARPPARIHRESVLTPASAPLHLHSQQSPPPRIQNHVVALVVAIGLGHAESSIRGLDHELHLRYIAPVLARSSRAGYGRPLRFPLTLRPTPSHPRSQLSSHNSFTPIFWAKKMAQAKRPAPFFLTLY